MDFKRISFASNISFDVMTVSTVAFLHFLVQWMREAVALIARCKEQRPSEVNDFEDVGGLVVFFNGDFHLCSLSLYVLCFLLVSEPVFFGVLQPRGSFKP